MSTRWYRDNPLEKGAFRHQLQYETEEKPYSGLRGIGVDITQWTDSLSVMLQNSNSCHLR